VDGWLAEMFIEFGFIQALVKFAHITTEIVGTDFVLHPTRKHVTALTLIPIAKTHPVSPALLIFLLYQRSCLFKGSGHGLIEGTVGTIEGIVAKPEVDHPCFHPDALIFQDIEALNYFGLCTLFAFTSHDSNTSLHVMVTHIPRVPIYFQAALGSAGSGVKLETKKSVMFWSKRQRSQSSLLVQLRLLTIPASDQMQICLPALSLLVVLLVFMAISLFVSSSFLLLSVMSNSSASMVWAAKIF
jgi:hypothetical protein